MEAFLVFVFARSDAGIAEELWWSFLRLTDPGYLGDDEGTSRRIISTLLTVAGYVFVHGYSGRDHDPMALSANASV